MSVLDKLYESSSNGNASDPESKIWCVKDHHHLYEFFPDFNNWLDGEEDQAQTTRILHNIAGLAQPSRAFYASDPKAYHQAFKVYRQERIEQVLADQYIRDQFADEHWFEKNESRFEQLIKRLEEKT